MKLLLAYKQFISSGRRSVVLSQQAFYYVAISFFVLTFFTVSNSLSYQHLFLKRLVKSLANKGLKQKAFVIVAKAISSEKEEDTSLLSDEFLSVLSGAPHEGVSHFLALQDVALLVSIALQAGLTLR